MPNCAIFLDRDGTINEDPGYLGEINKVFLLPGAGQGLSILKNEYNFKLIVISNQSGIARGLLTHNIVKSINKKINELLFHFNVQIDEFYFCPFHPDFSNEEECKCRKPSAIMVYKAAKEHNIDLTKSYFIGDMTYDIECGKNAELKTILVKTGNGKKSLKALKLQNNLPSFVAQNILDSCKFIKNDFFGAS
ncbi:MAG: D,D-heptose 1,7-bisphosphate phosphatase [Ignavibacteriales bacterium CG_4_9_14_3_um_filter_30_11]|nr:MAG: D,D-heptose 1,7-bisphosphate phosphatase [Ignavibacteriales bacterium CG_4_9_14_3_um_filter_30_11]